MAFELRLFGPFSFVCTDILHTTFRGRIPSPSSGVLASIRSDGEDWGGEIKTVSSKTPI